MSPNPKDLAARLLPLLDLTSLNDAGMDDIDKLCGRAVTPFGAVAAVCSWDGFAGEMKRRLAGSGVHIAVVINFPAGRWSQEEVVARTRGAVAAGADELDLVMPYRAWLAGDREAARAVIAATKAAAGDARLKVILETGAFPDAASIAEASKDAIASGADFLKTSSGKTAVGVTLLAADAMLGVIHETGGSTGFKAAGGIRTLDDAAAYLALAESRLGADWPTADRFRIGASKLLDLILDALGEG